MNTLQEVVAALERAQLLVEMPDLHTWPEITGLTADSRKVERGMLYCAVHGSARDGHEFVAAARERGAAAALVEREQGVDVPQILVRDGRRAAAVAAEAWRSEEHTSELQSQFHLVCRLLLEKKKQK